ncbi:hypothetical protein EV363DRAFT_1287438 [Boletus edulis]|nr:hypothetical protein EV363DRAFT_1287438 [Boletus edulis]
MGVVQLNIILLQRVTGRPGTRSTRCDPKVPQNRPFRRFNHILHLACEFLPLSFQSTAVISKLTYYLLTLMYLSAT